MESLSKDIPVRDRANLSRKSKDGPCKMTMLKAHLFDRLTIVFLCISMCIQRMKNV